LIKEKPNEIEDERVTDYTIIPIYRYIKLVYSFQNLNFRFKFISFPLISSLKINFQLPQILFIFTYMSTFLTIYLLLYFYHYSFVSKSIFNIFYKMI